MVHTAGGFNPLFIFLVTFFCVESLSGEGPLAPLSKIVIKSQTALFKRDKKDSSNIHLNYSKDVHVTFADGATIDTDNLDAFVNTKDNEIKKIIFCGNVFVKKGNKKLWADRAELIVKEKLCKLDGHVKVEQLKENDKDIPVTTECGHARISWEGDEIELEGSENGPVNTVIKLDGKLRSLSKNSKDKKHERHKSSIRSRSKKNSGRRGR